MFNTTAELLSSEIVSRYNRDGVTWAVADDDTLMAVYKDGADWWVVGFVTPRSLSDLPKWKAGKPGKKIP